MSDNEVINNVILNSCGPGFWIVDKKGGESQLDISWNLVSGCGSNHGIYWAAGVVSNGFDSYYSHNVFDGCYLGGFLSYSVNDGWEHNARTIFQNNIFLNTLPGTNIGDGGYGIYNKLGQDILSQNNCFYNNHAGNTYGGTVSDSDYFTDPKVSNYAGWTWTGSEWECPTVNPSEMGAIGDINTYDPISEDEIQEMDDIFDILKFEFITSGLQANKTIYVNGALYDSSQAPKNVNMTLEQHELGNQSYTLLYGPSEGLTQVQVKYAGKQAVHTLMIGESRGSSIYYSNCSIWSGDIYRIGDSFYFDGMIEPNDIDVTCYTVKGSFKPDFEVVRVEQEYKGLFNKFIILYLSILVVLLSIPVMVVFILFSKRF
jgi:hypothetical protein